MNCPVCFNPYALPGRVPHVLPCGHTFCGECIGSLTHAGILRCPTCRVEANAADVHINFALRDALPGAGAAVADPPVSVVPPVVVEFATEEELAIEVHISAEPTPSTWAEAGEESCLDVMVSLLPPEGKQRTPSDICCVVDVSDSMGTDAMIQDSPGVAVTHGLSVLDVVKHALRTIMHNLGDSDRLAVVAFANNAKVVFGLTPMSDEGKRISERHLEALHTDGMTNLWAGLQLGIEILDEAHEFGRLQHLMLLTDGVPTVNPPRGILPMLKRLREKREKEGGLLPCTINTFGFGYELDSELLNEIAIIGSGTYAFIPDAGFVGTIFVNAMTNLLVTMATNVTLTLTPLAGTTFPSKSVLGAHAAKFVGNALQVDLTSLQFGQRKDILVRALVPGEAAGADYIEARLRCSTRSACSDTQRDGLVARARGGDAANFELEPQRCRLAFVDGLRQAMKMMKQTPMDKMRGVPLPLPEVQARVQALADKLGTSSSASSEEMQALYEDLTGQVAEACSREEWYTKWGVHYLPSLMCAHSAQQCNNFKDPGVQHYGGDLFCDLRDQADDIFCRLPVPTPSAKPAPPPAAPAPEVAAAVAAAPATAARRAAPPVSMSTYYDRYSG